MAFEALKGTKTLQELAREYDLHPVQISDWKKVFAERMPHLFEKEAARGGLEEFEKERERLHAKIGELTVVVDFLQKSSNSSACSTCRAGRKSEHRAGPCAFQAGQAPGKAGRR